MRKRLILWAVALAAAFSVPAAAQIPAGQPIKIIHGSNAGAPQDVMLRILAEEMQKAIGQPVVVEPRPGASGQVAMAALKQAPADGTTIFSDATGITSILQLPDAAHKWSDFEPLYRLQLDPFALYVKKDKFADLNALIVEMKKRPNAVRVGGYGMGGPHQIALMRAMKLADATWTWIPFDSGSRAITAVMGDHIEAAMSNISVYGTFRERTQVVAQTAAERLKVFPDAPTFKELGIDVVLYHWRGMFLKRGTPEPTINQLFEVVGKAVKSERFQAYLRDSATLEGTMPRAEFVSMLEGQAKSDLTMLKELGMIK